MAHPTVFGGATPPPANYQISNSVRCVSARQAYFRRTQTAGDRKTLTISFWHKTTNSPVGGFFFSSGNSYPFNQSSFYGGGGAVTLTNYWSNNGGGVFQTYAQYRDPSAWQHFVLVIDTRREDTASRACLWVNGVKNTSLNTFSNLYVWGQYADTLWNCENVNAWIGNCANDTGFIDGYIGDYHLIDGQALSPTDFGRLDANGVWVPVKYTGTYGANGCRLEFKDGAALGADSSGNGNHWTAHGFTAADQMVDTPTNNFCTLNPIGIGEGWSLSNGNLTGYASAPNGNWTLAVGTIPMASKMMYEFKMVDQYVGGSTGSLFGLMDGPCSVGASYPTISLGNTQSLGRNSLSFNIWHAGAAAQYNGTIVWSGSIRSTPNSDVYAVLYDPATGRVYLAQNGVWVNDANPDQGTGYICQIQNDVLYFPAFCNVQASFQINAGQTAWWRTYANASSFKPVCTANLPAVAIPQPSKHHNVKLYTGTGSTQSVTGAGFRPDFVWTKHRGPSGTQGHSLFDTIRGATKYLRTNNTNTETTDAESLTSFDADGFTTGAYSDMNTASQAYAAWLWKAGDSVVTNTAGSVSSQVSANTSAGFSIVTFSGNGLASTVGHGLGAAPAMIIQRARTPTAMHWMVYHKAANASPATGHLYLELTYPFTSDSTSWNNTMPTATVWNVGPGASSNTNYNGATYVAYCFAEIPGYSRFGSYTGNGSSDGPFVYCGFRPRWIMLKRTDSPGDWYCYDTARDPRNVAFHALYLGKSNPEDTSTVADALDVLSSGFKLRNLNSSDFNVLGGQFIYAAFAEHPFGGANVAPSPAR